MDALPDSLIAALIGFGYFINAATDFVPMLKRHENFFMLWTATRLISTLLIFVWAFMAESDYVFVVTLIAATSLLFHVAFCIGCLWRSPQSD